MRTSLTHGGPQLNLFIAIVAPSSIAHNAGIGRKRDRMIERLGLRALGNLEHKTVTDLRPGGCPVPTRTRVYVSLPSLAWMDLRPLWPPWPTAHLHANRPRLEVHLVVNDEDFLGSDLVCGRELADGTTARVHVRLRLGKQQLLATVFHVRDQARRTRSSNNAPRAHQQAGRVRESQRYAAFPRTRGRDCPNLL